MDTSHDGPQFGVGLIGAGVAAQAIHLPVIKRLGDRLALRSVWDIDPVRAGAVAQQEGVTAARDLDALLGDESIDVVAVCSPAQLHVEHAIAAMRAGKRAVLIEKPVCLSGEEAKLIASVARETGAFVLSGSMHLHDPAWHWAEGVATTAAFVPRSIASRIVVPPNAQFETWAFEPATTAGPRTDGPTFTKVDLMRLAVMELAIHDLPLVRRLLPFGKPEVRSARLLEPFGYAVTLEQAGVLVDLFGLAHGHWLTDWSIEAIGPSERLTIAFTPSFVQAGSGAASWTARGETRRFDAADTNGYVHEWHHVVDVLAGRAVPPDVEAIVKDYGFATMIADQACAIIAAGDTV